MVSNNFVRNSHGVASLEFLFDSTGHKYDFSINLFCLYVNYCICSGHDNAMWLKQVI